MTSIDKAAIAWTLAIVAVGVGIAGFGSNITPDVPQIQETASREGMVQQQAATIKEAATKTDPKTLLSNIKMILDYSEKNPKAIDPKTIEMLKESAKIISSSKYDERTLAKIATVVSDVSEKYKITINDFEKPTTSVAKFTKQEIPIKISPDIVDNIVDPRPPPEPEISPFTAISNGLWTDPTIWYGGEVPSSQNNPDLIIIPEGITIEVNYNGMRIPPDATMINNGELLLDYNQGTSLNQGTLINRGTISIPSWGHAFQNLGFTGTDLVIDRSTLINDGGTINIDGLLINRGADIINQNNGNIFNNGELRNFASTNGEEIPYHGIITNELNSKIINTERIKNNYILDSQLSLGFDESDLVRAIITNNGEFQNNGEFTDSCKDTFVNSGQFTGNPISSSICGSQEPAPPIVYVAENSGFWNDDTTWNQNNIPSDWIPYDIKIPQGIVVTIPTDYETINPSGGHIEVEGTLVVSPYGKLLNKVNSKITVHGTGTIKNETHQELSNRVGITNEAGGTIINSGIIYNEKIIKNYGVIRLTQTTDENPSTLYNTRIIHNYNYLHNYGGSIYHDGGVIKVHCGATLDNSGLLEEYYVQDSRYFGFC